MCYNIRMIKKEYCENCGRELNPKDITELELDKRDNTYHLPEANEIPEEFSQGVFSFGKDCAKKLLKESKHV